ncbi:DUF6397 family protein [Streptomyces sp. L2]|uniref:DUF6397 family protein n=1 Tax=Streptomyces sp. L2 TaxID=2162665 RepID=UPI001011089D|nr:DUF6397 family protein [Streptomyces sp. L2]
MSAEITAPARPLTWGPSRAARELGLRRSEFDLAVHLGLIRTVPDEGGAGRGRIERAEVDSLLGQDGFPGTVRERVEVVGVTQGAALMEMPAGRFSRLARLGLLVPVRFYLNRYRAVVWLYLAEELRQFAADGANASLLKGPTPEPLRGRLAAGVDLRARNWRGRQLGFLLRQADDDPWQRAGAFAAFLDPVEVADVVRDPDERARLHRFRPGPPGHGAPGSPSAHLAEAITTAADPDEIGWLRSALAQEIRETRAHRPSPHPAAPQDDRPERTAAARTRPARGATPGRPAPTAPVPPRGLRAWLRRRGPRPAAV